MNKKVLNKKRKSTPKKINKKLIELKFIYRTNKKNINKDMFRYGSSIKKSRNNINNILKLDLTNFNNEELYFDKLREKAYKLIESINKINDKNIIIERINKALSYDNINSDIIILSLKRCSELNLADEYNKLLSKYRLVINKSLSVNNGINFILNNKTDIPENEKEIKYDFIEILKILLKLAKLNYYTQDYLDKLKFTIKIEKESLTFINNNEEKNQKNEVENLVNKLSVLFKKYKSIDDFNNNQPIKYELNPTLYFISLINTIYDIFIINESEENSIYKFNINIKKINQISLIDNFVQKIIIKSMLNANNINYDIDKLLKLFVFNLDSQHINNHKNFGQDIIIRNDKEKCLTFEYALNYINNQKNNSKNNIISINREEFSIKDMNYIINFTYKDYPENILSDIYNEINLNMIQKFHYKKCFFDSFQKSNFFSKIEIDYMKFLVREILNSYFFQELLKIYSENNIIPNQFLKDKKIQDYILENITFLPYDEKDFDTQSMTFINNAEIIISGYPFADETCYYKAEIHHILELGRKVIIIMHELIHSFKRYLSMATNGLIDSVTKDENDNIFEAGFLFEHVVFGWDYNKYKEKNKKLFKGNENLKNKLLDVQTALLILNPDLYNNDISSFRDIIYNNSNSNAYKNFTKMEMNKKLKEFLVQMGFKTEQEIEMLKKDKSLISVKRKNFHSNMISAGFKCGNEKKRKNIFN